MKQVIPQTVAYWLPVNHALFDCLVNSPGSYSFIDVAAYADNMLQTLCQLVPNILLLEPDPTCYERSVDLVRRVRMWPRLPVKCVVVLPTNANYLNAFDELDISGKLSLQHIREELANCLNRITDGYRFSSPHLRQHTGKVVTRCSVKTANGLTARENEIIELIALGYTNKEIAERLFLSVKTVETHKGNVVHKLNLHSTSELRQFMRQEEQAAKGILLG